MILRISKAKLDSITEIFTTALKPLTILLPWVSTNGTNVLNHVASTLNPHNVTKTQVGLSNVPNTILQVRLLLILLI
jgi:hypothetical protein